MENKNREGDEKKQKKESKLSGQGDTFYEAISTTVVAPREINLPRVNTKTLDLIESIVIFFAGTALVLLLMRITLMIFGINGGNLLTYLLYAASYPFVMTISSHQTQIPVLTNNILYENIVIMAVYAVVFYGILKIIKVFRMKESNN